MANHPNRSASQNPTPEKIRAAREAAGLTQTAAASLLYTVCRVWQQWESGERRMHPAFWELFNRKSAERGPKMTREQFESAVKGAESMRRAESSPIKQDYWMGYQRGLRRHFHGEKFGTEDEHTLWLEMISDEDEQRAARGRGYADGLAGMPLEEAMGK